MTKCKTTILRVGAVGALLALSPGLALAQGCAYEKQQVTMSCAPGMTPDAATGTCVAEVTS